MGTAKPGGVIESWFLVGVDDQHVDSMWMTTCAFCFSSASNYCTDFPLQIGLFNLIDLHHVPELARLLREGETLADLQKLSPEQILIRWVNYHLENSGTDRRLANFTTDIMDSEIYTHLMNQIAPKDRHVTLDPLNIRVSQG